MRHAIETSFLLVLLLAGSGGYQDVAAQGICDFYDFGQCSLGPTGYHKFSANLLGGEGEDYTCEWETCHTNQRVGHCGDKHWICEGGSVPEEHFKFISVIVDALANGSYLEVMSAFQEARAAGVDRVKFNSERGAWQLLSCSRNVVVAHVTVRSPDHTVGDRSQPQTGLR